MIQWAKATKVALHTMSNELVEMFGDLAFSKCYFVAYSIIDFDGSEPTGQTAGRFIDRWERGEDHRWKIASRIYIIEWRRPDPVGNNVPVRVGFKRGQRSRDDLSYVSSLAER